tara:strand:- start:85 stop:252 length:168 start_codon:yes stop_codon:yes gene_type:complete
MGILRWVIFVKDELARPGTNKGILSILTEKRSASLRVERAVQLDFVYLFYIGAEI